MNNPDINLSTILSDVFKKTPKKAEQGNADEQFHLGIGAWYRQRLHEGAIVV